MEPFSEGDSRRRVVASYESYEEAQRAIGLLADEKFPVEHVAIVAEDLRFVEQVSGRMGYGQAALRDAGVGAVVGVLSSFFLGLFGLIDPIFGLIDPLVSAVFLALYGLIFGAIVGAIIGLVAHAASSGRRDFSPVDGMQAGCYNVTADEEIAEEVRQKLGERPQSPDRQTSR